MDTAAGLFVAFEGGEGSGKSTQARLLAEWLDSCGHRVVHTREPGGTPVGGKIRSILLDPTTGTMNSRTEALLYAADKAEHVETVILPALESGSVVACDRYIDSTLAYQGAGRTLAFDELEHIVRWATRGLRPHLTILLDIDPETGLTRCSDHDRIEAEPLDFHLRVRESFLGFARQDPSHYCVVDATQSAEQIQATVRAHIGPFLEPK